MAHDVPALGYRTYVPAKAEPGPSDVRADPATATLESPFLKVVLDPARGTVASLIDKRTGRELVDRSDPHAFGQYLYERFDNDQVLAYCKAYCRPGRPTHADFSKPGLPPASEVAYKAASPRDFKVHFEQSPISATAVMQAGPGAGVPHGVTIQVRLDRGQPYVELEITLQEKPLEPWPEAGWLCLPLAVADPQFRLGRVGCITDPARDLIGGTNRHIFGLNTGLTITDARGRGVGICPLDHPLVSLDVPGCWKYSPDFVPKRPVVFVNLFNNQWNTNFRLWNGGTWSSRVRLWPVTACQAEASLIAQALEARVPLQAVAAAGTAGQLAATQAGLELSRRGVQVTAWARIPTVPAHCCGSGNPPAGPEIAWSGFPWASMPNRFNPSTCAAGRRPLPSP